MWVAVESQVGQVAKYGPRAQLLDFAYRDETAGRLSDL